MQSGGWVEALQSCRVEGGLRHYSRISTHNGFYNWRQAGGMGHSDLVRILSRTRNS